VPTFTVRTPAKVNLFLHVLGRRADGFHALDSRFHTVGIYDHLTLTDIPSGQVTLSCSDPALAGDGNLVVRAARALLEHTGTAHGVRARLEKHIPAGAGLGGGSSDAAAALLGLNRLWRLGLPVAELQPLAAALGSDVPFFLHGGAARIGGRGEVVTPEPPGGGWCVLLFPGVHVDTGRVFAAFAAAHSSDGRLTQTSVRTIITTAFAPDSGPTRGRSGARGGMAPSGGLSPQPVGNDLETVACSLFPQVHAALGALRQAGGADVRMSGSGGAVFCLAPSRREAEEIRGRLSLAPEWRVWVVPLVASGPLVEMAPPKKPFPAG